jgi:4-methylaminobutanoate oxidase (formaldehyde-forming)
MGPKSRELLERLSRSDVSDAAFGFGSSREIDLGYATVRATRISYVGELGWELYVPAEFAVGAYQDLVRAGADLGLVNAGYYAIESMRLEKAYRAFGRELTPDDNPVEAGLLFACKLGTGIGFLGREAVEQARAAGPRRRPHRVAGPLCARTKDRSASLSRLAFALAGPGFDDSKVTSRADRNFFPG